MHGGSTDAAESGGGGERISPSSSSGERCPCMHSRDKTVELNAEEHDMMAGYAVEYYNVELVLKLVVGTADHINW